MGKRATKVDVSEAVNEYINKEDWRINANANTNYSHASLINNLAGKVIANYWLDEVYSKEEGDAHRNGDYHIHDLDSLAPYCFSIDTKVSTVYDGDLSFGELVEKYADKKFLVWSTNEGGLSVMGTAHSPRLTRKNAELVKVVMEDGYSVKCTPDHLFRVVKPTGLEWKAAKDLTQEDELLYRFPKNTVARQALKLGLRVKEVQHLDEREDVYDLTVDEYHNFSLSNGVIVHNCCGHDFQKILDEGFNGVIGRVGSKPPKHIRESLYQLANYFGILQAEWAGAQAVSSFDTYLSPHVFFDTKICGLTYDDIKKAMRNFVFNLNVPSRWGQCVPETYKCLKADGTWVSHKDLKVGDEIVVVDMKTGKMKIDTITRVNLYDSPKVLHRYSDGDKFNFYVTPNHRVIHREVGGNPCWEITESSKILENRSEVQIPTAMWEPMTPEEYMGDESFTTDGFIELATLAYIFGKIGDDNILRIYTNNGILRDRINDICDDLDVEHKYWVNNNHVGVYEFERKPGYPSHLFDILESDKKILRETINLLSPRQSSIIIDTWTLFNGSFNGCKWILKVDDKETQEFLAGLVLKTGKSAVCRDTVDDLTGEDSHQLFIFKRGPKKCYVKEVESDYDKVWCPTTKTGTFVCMTDDGIIFFTGNSPFTNVTIDWTVPNMMKDLAPTRGGKNYFQSIIDEWSEKEDGESKKNKILEAVKERFKEVDPETYDLLKDDESTLLSAFTYKFFQKEMNIINKAFYEVLNEGDMLGQPFTFPIPTINITEDFEWEGENADLLFENTAKYGSSYFQNFIGSQYMIDENGNKVRDPNAYTPNDVRSMCPLALDTPVITNHGIKRLDKLEEQYDKVMLHGIWYSFKKVTDIPKQRCLVITLDGVLNDGKPIQFVVGEEHLQPVLDQVTQTYVKKPAKYLTESDMIPVEVAYDANTDKHLQPIGNRFMYGRDRLQYIQIKSITEIPSEPLMCIEVNNEEHNFTLGNGVITSNCRLQLDKKALRKKGRRFVW